MAGVDVGTSSTEKYGKAIRIFRSGRRSDEEYALASGLMRLSPWGTTLLAIESATSGEGADSQIVFIMGEERGRGGMDGGVGMAGRDGEEYSAMSGMCP